jgi:transcription-repair coupling factor (superfamily II helicase)
VPPPPPGAAPRAGGQLQEKGLSAFADLFWKPEDQRRPWTALTTALKDWSRSRRQTVLSFRSDRSRRKFLTLAAQEDLALSTEYSPDARGLFALVSPLKKGFDLSWSGLLVLAEDLLQPEPAAETRRVSRDKPFQGLERYEDLLEGDLLVHRDYGLARFGGLHRLSVGEAANNDYLLLFFDKDDRLYLPVDRLNLVQRYKGPEGVVPALDKLGGARWRSTTERARKAVEQIAAELVEMYAFRRVAKGFRYGPPAELYWEFETTFGFEETPDQAKAVTDVFADMERPEPMDRLVCGDVGFGKTEVALRAAFRAVLEGRQVALLCPTTVLAEQHYQTFLKRMESFPVRVAMLSPFVPKHRQKAVVAATARGEVDMAMSFEPLHAENSVLDGTYKDTVRTLVMADGSLFHLRFLAIPAAAPNKPGAMVLADLVLSPEAQLSKFQPKAWGDFPAVDVSRLPESFQTKIVGTHLGKSSLTFGALGVAAIPEVPGEYGAALDQGWAERFGGR